MCQSRLFKLGMMFIACLINNGANAANKTGVAELLKTGECRLDLSYTTMNVTLLGGGSPSMINNGAVIAPLSGRIAQNVLLATFNLGVSNKTNLSFSYGMQNSVQEFEYTFSPNQYVATSNSDGTINPEIGVQYLLTEKKKDEIGAILYGAVSPAATPSYSPVPEIKTNGAVTSTGSRGGGGNDFTTIRIGTTISFPVYVGYAYYDLQYNDGFVTSIDTPHGTDAEFTFGYEQSLSDKLTLRPYLKATAVGSSYVGQNQTSSFSKYELGIFLIGDITQRFSWEIVGQYSTLNNKLVYNSNGTTQTLATNGYALGLHGLFFFY